MIKRTTFLLAAAADVASFYKGRTITVMVPSGLGASLGLYGRLFTKHFSNHIPGNPTVILTSRPGGGSTNGATYAYNAAPRILAASFIAYLIGEFTNSYVLAKMKIATNGRFLWARTIGSTLVGQGLDSAVFIAIAFIEILPTLALVTAIVTQWLFKSAYEACTTPVTYGVVNYLKRSEGIDVYDRDTKFNPLLIAD